MNAQGPVISRMGLTVIRKRPIITNSPIMMIFELWSHDSGYGSIFPVSLFIPISLMMSLHRVSALFGLILFFLLPCSLYHLLRIIRFIIYDKKGARLQTLASRSSVLQFIC